MGAVRLPKILVLTIHDSLLAQVYDMHTLQNRFYFDGGTLATLHTAFPLIVDKVRQLQEEEPSETIAIAFPDEVRPGRGRPMAALLASGYWHRF